MSRLSLAHRHDPYWDVDGSSARRSRHQQLFVRWTVRVLAVVILAALLARLPAIDPAILTAPEAKPILAAAVFSLLAAFMLLALARMRSGSSN